MLHRIKGHSILYINLKRLKMACKYCGLSDNSLSMFPDIDSLPPSSEDLWTIVQIFDTEIARVETLLNRLVLNRSLLKRKVNYHSSPVLRIPSDITSEIFKAYLHEEGETGGREAWRGEDSSRLGTPNMPQPSLPLLLGSVCKAWREVAWSMPWIWSSISLKLDHPSPHSAILLDEWFSRSGQCALNISLRSIFPNLKREDAVQEIIGVVARLSERWRHINFDFPWVYYNGLRSVQGRVPLLESVSVRLLGMFDYLGPLQIFSVAPQLRAVRCEDFPPQGVQFPFSQLTSFSGHWQYKVVDCLEVLQEASQLTRARFEQTTIDWTGSPATVMTPHQVLAPHLQSLRFTCVDSDLITTLLDNLTLPDLCELSLSVTGGWVLDFGHLSFVSFIRRSACPLESLSLSGLHLTDDVFLHCMQVIPSLNELIIDFPGDVTNRTICNLVPHLIPNLLPKLQTLSISSSSLVIDFIELHRMLSARWNADGLGHGVARLQFVLISGIGIVEGTHSPVIPLLQELTAEGMKIWVETGSDRSTAYGWNTV
jgi:hypothetical protein